MMDMIKKLQQFFKYWTVRYLLTSELYMVEPWEKLAVHVLFATLFGLAWFFNYSIVISAISHLRGATSYTDPQKIL